MWQARWAALAAGRHEEMADQAHLHDVQASEELIERCHEEIPSGLVIVAVDIKHIVTIRNPVENKREGHEGQDQWRYDAKSYADHRDVRKRRENAGPFDAGKPGLPLPFLTRRDVVGVADQLGTQGDRLQ